MTPWTVACQAPLPIEFSRQKYWNGLPPYTLIHNKHSLREEELKSLLTKVKKESEKVGLKLNIQKTKTIASGPVTSWHIDGEKVETGTDFLFLGSQINVDSDCSHEIKRRLLLGKAMTNLDSVLKSRQVTLQTKVCIVKVKVFPKTSSNVLM